MPYNEELHRAFIDASDVEKTTAKKGLTKREKVILKAKQLGVSPGHIYKLINYGKLKI